MAMRRSPYCVSGCSMLSRACEGLDIDVVIQWSHEQEKGKD